MSKHNEMPRFIKPQLATLKTKAPKAAFVAPEKGSVIIPEAITKKSKQSDAPAEAEAETTEAE